MVPATEIQLPVDAQAEMRLRKSVTGNSPSTILENKLGGPLPTRPFDNTQLASTNIQKGRKLSNQHPLHNLTPQFSGNVNTRKKSTPTGMNPHHQSHSTNRFTARGASNYSGSSTGAGFEYQQIIGFGSTGAHFAPGN